MEVELKPSEIRYLSRSISAYFNHGGHILNTFEEIFDGDLSPGDVPMISVFQRGSRWYVYDGERRLYCYKSLEKRGIISTIKVKVESEVDWQIVKQKQTWKNGGVSVTVADDNEFHGKHSAIICKNHVNFVWNDNNEPIAAEDWDDSYGMYSGGDYDYY